MSKGFMYDSKKYIKEGSQYFALEAAKLYNVPLYLCTDTATGEFKYAFVEIFPEVYLDAKGVFYSFFERDDLLKNTKMSVYDIETAKDDLKHWGVSITNVEMKRNVREFLRNNLLTFMVELNTGFLYKMGVCAISNAAKRPVVITLDYIDEEKRWGRLYHTIPRAVFVESIKECRGFVSNDGWYYRN